DQLISPDEFAGRVDRIRELTARYDGQLGAPTTYELGTLLAFGYFADHALDLAVVEVGLGGRLDATNVLDTELAIFTPISYDHTEVLGPTLASIATEKAGIIKPGNPVVTSSQAHEAMAVIERVALEKGARLILAQPARAAAEPDRITAGQAVPAQPAQRLLVPGGTGQLVSLSLLGEHQLTNAGVAIEAARWLGLDEDAIARGLESVRWPGRLEVLRRDPLVVVDGAHNVDSMEKLAAAMRRHFGWQRLRVIAGFSADKDIPGIARVLNELADEIVLTRSKHPRSADPSSIARHFPGARIAGSLQEALAGQRSHELALVTGSLYLDGEARLALGVTADEDPL
ncbi:MAG TPA: cyanophycin synthetase, partial [Chloroflexota bacterium]|nr:cyanophycin synthetase [Chloroflexota bacterium]